MNFSFMSMPWSNLKLIWQIYNILPRHEFAFVALAYVMLLRAGCVSRRDCLYEQSPRDCKTGRKKLLRHQFAFEAHAHLKIETAVIIRPIAQ